MGLLYTVAQFVHCTTMPNPLANEADTLPCFSSLLLHSRQHLKRCTHWRELVADWSPREGASLQFTQQWDAGREVFEYKEVSLQLHWVLLYHPLAKSLPASSENSHKSRDQTMSWSSPPIFKCLCKKCCLMWELESFFISFPLDCAPLQQANP